MRIAKPKLLRRIESKVRSRLGLPFPWETRSVLGHELELRAGSLPTYADYDDAWMYACIQHSEVMFDVGANVGQSALLALLTPNIRQCVLVEANPKALSVAAENLIRNNLATRARFVGAFASERADQTVDFWTVGTGAASSMFAGHAVTASKAGSMQRIPTTTLDTISDAYSVTPDLVKIDVEGAEIKVLAGSLALARKRRTRFLVEMHSPPELPMLENATQVLAWAKSVDYATWYLSEGTKLESPTTIQHRGRCHLLFQPSEWAYPEWLVGIQQSAPLPGN